MLFKEWGAYRDVPFEYKKGDSWDVCVQQGVQLLEKFAQDDRIRIPQPKKNLQVKMLRSLGANDDFVAYIDALGELDGIPCVMDWKTTDESLSGGARRTSRARSPAHLLLLDQRNLRVACRVCPEELPRSNTSRPRSPTSSARTSATWLKQLSSDRSWPVLSHSGIRFPQNGCVSCPHLGLSW